MILSLHFCHILQGIFGEMHLPVSFVKSFRLAACNNSITAERIFIKTYIGKYTQLCPQILISVKIRQKWLTLNMNSYLCSCSHLECNLRVICHIFIGAKNVSISEKNEYILYSSDKNLICADGPMARTVYNLTSHKFSPMFKERKVFDDVKVHISED
jgi:hypothetical protein